MTSAFPATCEEPLDVMALNGQKPFVLVDRGCSEDVATSLPTDVSGSSDEESKASMVAALVDESGSSDEEACGTHAKCSEMVMTEWTSGPPSTVLDWTLWHHEGSVEASWPPTAENVCVSQLHTCGDGKVGSDVLLTSAEAELVDLDPEEGALRGQILLSMLSDFGIEAMGASCQDDKTVVNTLPVPAASSNSSCAWTKKAVDAPLFTPSLGLTCNFDKGDLDLDHFKSSLAAMAESAFGDWCCGVYQNVDGIHIELQKSEPLTSWSDTKAEAYARNALYQALDALEQNIWGQFEDMVIDVKRIQGSTQLLVQVMSSRQKTGLCWEFAQGYCPRHNRCRWIHAVPSFCIVGVAYSSDTDVASDLADLLKSL